MNVVNAMLPGPEKHRIAGLAGQRNIRAKALVT